jgi:N-methylhydantoinase A
VRRLVNFTMAQAMRLVSVERGHDPRDYTIVAYGGGGPLHAVQLAEELGCAQVLVPRGPGIISALGLLIAGTQQDFIVTRIANAAEATHRFLTDQFAGLTARARREFESYGIPWDAVQLHHFLDMRYIGQAYELTMPVDDFVTGRAPASDLTRRFHDFHRLRYGHASSREGVEIANFRVVATHRSAVERLGEAWQPAAGGPVIEDAPVLVDGKTEACRFYRRETLPAGATVPGPAVVEEATATTFVPRGWTGVVDPGGNLLIRRA